MLFIALFKDIHNYLNSLNTDFQGNKKLICDLIWFNIFKLGIENQKCINFSTI